MEITEELLDELELKALTSLVSLASEGNAAAANQALVALQRIREHGSAGLHQKRMEALAETPAALCAYLGELGTEIATVEARLGRKMSREEKVCWSDAQEQRLIEVRAVELSRMRATGEVPKWATRKL